MNNLANNEKKNSRPAWQRVAAVVTLIALAVMIIATLVCAIMHVDKNIVFGLLFCDIIIPILIWVFFWITGIYKAKGQSMADEYNRLNEAEKND